MKNDAEKLHEDELESVEEVKELSEDQEKLSKLTDSELAIIDKIESWLKTNRGYKDYDFTDEFKVGKLIPLLKLAEHEELVFNSDSITQTLRMPIDLIDKSGNVVRKITELKYKARYQDYELRTYTKGIDPTKDTMSYINGQVAMLTNTARSIIGKLWDTDSNNSKLITTLYFLG